MSVSGQQKHDIFFCPVEQIFFYNTELPMPGTWHKDVPSGKHKIILEVHASSLEERFEEKAEAFFEVQ